MFFRARDDASHDPHPRGRGAAGRGRRRVPCAGARHSRRVPRHDAASPSPAPPGDGRGVAGAVRRPLRRRSQPRRFPLERRRDRLVGTGGADGAPRAARRGDLRSGRGRAHGRRPPRGHLRPARTRRRRRVRRRGRQADRRSVRARFPAPRRRRANAVDDGDERRLVACAFRRRAGGAARFVRLFATIQQPNRTDGATQGERVAVCCATAPVRKRGRTPGCSR
jgi:hypothetical protein